MNSLKEFIYFLCGSCRPQNSATVRFAFPLVFAVATLLGAAAVVTSSKSFIHIESTAKTLHAGDVFTMDVYVNAHVAVNAVDISLEFPKEQIEIIGIDTGESVISIWTKEPYIEGNKIIFRGGTFRKGFRGDHLIATVNARAIETGLAQVSINDVLLLAGDGAGSKVTVSKNAQDSTTFYINEQGSTQEASSEKGINLQGIASIVIITDIDGDGAVTLTDISRFMSAWSSRSVVYDFNGDGKMSFRDFGIILADSFIR